MKGFHDDNYKALMKETEVDTKYGIEKSVWIRRSNTNKMSVLLTVIFTFNAISFKLAMAFFTIPEKNSKIYM